MTAVPMFPDSLTISVRTHGVTVTQAGSDVTGAFDA